MGGSHRHKSPAPSPTPAAPPSPRTSSPAALNQTWQLFNFPKAKSNLRPSPPTPTHCYTGTPQPSPTLGSRLAPSHIGPPPTPPPSPIPIHANTLTDTSPIGQKRQEEEEGTCYFCNFAEHSNSRKWFWWTEAFYWYLYLYLPLSLDDVMQALECQWSLRPFDFYVLHDLYKPVVICKVNCSHNNHI